IGEHTWFFKDKTLSMAIDFPVYVAVSKREDQTLKFNFVQLDEKKRCSLSVIKFKKEDKWANALKAVIYSFLSEKFEFPGMNFTVYTDILPSAGFGITTAIKIAAAWALRELNHFRISDERLISIVEKANRQFLNSENRKADNFAAVYSKKNSVVVTDYSENSYKIIPFSFEDHTIILTDTGVPRVFTWNEESILQPENVLLLGELKNRKSNVFGGWTYEENSSEISEVFSVTTEEVKRRLVCTMHEHKCVLDAVSALEKKEFEPFARAVEKSHCNMRDLYDISCPEIDWLVKRVYGLDENPVDLRNPVNCGRITGKGFGRCTYSIIRNSDVDKFKEKLGEFERIFGFSPKCYIVKPSSGVKIL
ncbi:MAG: galactokinase, partial [Spirochaetia bacterium]|nr:galactokinase [Spirochaetia bacterium]